MKKKLLLFRLECCPYCAKAEAALDKKEMEYKKIEVPSPKEERALLKQLSGQDSVPVLIEVIGFEEQDDDILEWLENQ
ncbi:MAG: glutaredoxin [Nanoarchaeota archaeon]|jgi:glutaredoxin|nr:glutaredoxin [Nanoarchaeota archaeon]|tara:strand:+ start:3150 stop:3383 length:234 start_codon:yes stop_codon:yes gene_type:complete